jgi:DNA-binding transcriptional LysR family regulator
LSGRNVVWDARRVSVDLRHFRSFVVVAEEGHIGRAARRLFITQPALSRQMQQLEREVDAAILVRTARGVERAAVRAFAPFAAEHLASSCTERIAAP